MFGMLFRKYVQTIFLHFFLYPLLCSSVSKFDQILSLFADGLIKLIIIISKMLEDKIINLNLKASEKIELQKLQKDLY